MYKHLRFNGKKSHNFTCHLPLEITQDVKHRQQMERLQLQHASSASDRQNKF